MPKIKDNQMYFAERQKEIAEAKELIKSKLLDIVYQYRETTDNIDRLKVKIKDKDCLKLLNEIYRQTVAMHDLYAIALDLMIDSNQSEFRIMLDIIESIGKQDKQ